jgi:hypothetical protein
VAPAALVTVTRALAVAEELLTDVAVIVTLPVLVPAV